MLMGNLDNPLRLGVILAGISVCLTTYTPVSIGFPGRWDGDRLKQVPCNATGIPKWLSGYLLIQMSASYGPVGPPGTNLIHLFDGLGAVGRFKIYNGQATFSAAYYPTRGYKIWDFFDRDMRESKVAWPTSISPFNVNATKKWASIAPPYYLPFNPNIDFWRIGKSVVAGTEIPEVGYTFDPETLSNFRMYPFRDTDSEGLFNNGSLRPMGLVIHSRRDPKTDLIWSVVPAYESETGFTHSIVFTVTPEGTRKVQGRYTWGRMDLSYCDGINGKYLGDSRALPGYMHSITSTKRYLILPASSALLNPCPEPRRPPSPVQIPTDNILHVNKDMPIRFLIYDKERNDFLPILEGPQARWPSHQLNAYEIDADGKQIYADMLVYENMKAYNEYYMLSYLQRNPYPQAVRAVRYVLDLESQVVYENALLPTQFESLEYPQINHVFNDKPYNWAYAVKHPYTQGGSITKMNVNEPTGRLNVEYRPTDPEALSQPVFVPRPNSGVLEEEDGVLLVRGINLKQGKTIVHVVDARTMSEVGAIESPIQLPFGFHSKFYSFSSLNIKQAAPEPTERAKPAKTEPTLSIVKATRAPVPTTTAATSTATTPEPETRPTAKQSTTTTAQPRPVAIKSTATKVDKPTLPTFRTDYLAAVQRAHGPRPFGRLVSKGGPGALESGQGNSENARGAVIVVRPINPRQILDGRRHVRQMRSPRPYNWYNNPSLGTRSKDAPPPPPQGEVFITRAPWTPPRPVVMPQTAQPSWRGNQGQAVNPRVPSRPRVVNVRPVAPLRPITGINLPPVPASNPFGPVSQQGINERLQKINNTIATAFGKVNTTEVVTRLCDVITPVLQMFKIDNSLCDD